MCRVPRKSVLGMGRTHWMTNPYPILGKRFSSKLGVDTGRKTRSFEEQLKKLKAQQDQSSSTQNEESANQTPTLAGHGTKTLAQRLSQSLRDPLRSKDFLGQVDKGEIMVLSGYSFKNRRGTLSEEALRSLKEIIQLSDCNWYEKFTIFKGGEDSFCMGLDIRTLAMNRENRPHEVQNILHHTFNNLVLRNKVDPQHVQYQLGWIIAKSSKKRLALLDGHCIGAGAALALAHTSQVLASNFDNARSLTAHQHAHFLGMSPGNGCSFYLPRLKGHIGLYLALTGARINGADALYAGDVAQAHPMDPGHSNQNPRSRFTLCATKPTGQMPQSSDHLLETCASQVVRAFETDKDGKPSWQPQPSNEEVTLVLNVDGD
eukprot:768320-Hanusia_phi.AAC.7